MNKTAAAMEFERAAEYDLDSGNWHLAPSSGSWLKICRIVMFLAIMWTRVDVCPGFLCLARVNPIERDADLFPYYNDPDEDFLTYIGQFYQKIPPQA